jgi:hypothetical protein
MKSNPIAFIDELPEEKKSEEKKSEENKSE